MSSLSDILAGTAVEVVIFGVAGGILYRFWRGAHFLPQRKTLSPFNKGLVLDGERVVKVLNPGNHWIRPRLTIVPVDVRARPFQMPSRDLRTSDGEAVRIRLHGEYKVNDPERFIRESSDAHASFYLALDREVALAIAERERIELLQNPGSSADRIRERIEPRAAQLGIKLIQLEISDIFAIDWTDAGLDDERE